MKTVLAILLLSSISLQVFSQKSLYIRVYNLEHKKIVKGRILSTTDTSLKLRVRNDTIDISVSIIGMIKTKRSPGHNILVGAMIGTSAGAIAGAATAEPDKILGYSAGEGAILGVILGAPVGAIIGAATLIFKKSEKIIIDGDSTKWKAFREKLSI